MKKLLVTLYIAILSVGVIGSVSAETPESAFNMSESTPSGIEKAREFTISPDGQSYAFVIPDWRGGDIFKDGKVIPDFTLEAFTEGPGGWYSCSAPAQHIFQYSPDGKSFTFVGRKKKSDGKVYVVKDGVSSKWYQQILPESLLYSPDGKIFSFATQDKSGQFDVINGTESKKRYGYIQYMAYGPDNAVVFVWTRGHDLFYVSNDTETKISGMGKETTWYDSKYRYTYTINWQPSSPLVFSPDRKDSAFVILRSISPGDSSKGKYYLVKNGVVGKELSWNGILQYSQKDKDFLLVSWFDADKNQTAFGLSQCMKPNDYVDGRTPPYITQAKSDTYKAVVMKDGVEWKKYDEIFGLHYSSDGKDVFYFGLNQPSSTFFIRNGIEIGKYDEVSSYVFSDDSRHFAFVAPKSGKWILNVDGFETQKYGKVSQLAFAPDGRTLFFVADRNGKNILVKLAKKDGALDNPGTIAKPAPAVIPAIGLKIITEKQKETLQKQVEKFTEARIYAIAEKIDSLLKWNTISETKRNLLKDVLYVLYIANPSDGGLSRSEVDHLWKIFTTDKSDAFESLLQ